MISGHLPTSSNRKWVMLSAVLVGTFMSTLSGSIVTHWRGLLAHQKIERRV